jgi:aryl-alcohol dehydrogenase-like predicted oxidoreductase
VSVQNYYNLLHRDDEEEVLPECRRLGLAYLPYFTLASGLLTGKYRRGEAPAAGTRLDRWGERAAGGTLTDRNFDVVDALTAWAEDHGHTLLDLAFAWLLSRPEVASVIAGATSAAQVTANVAAGGWQLTGPEVAEVDALAPIA